LKRQQKRPVVYAYYTSSDYDNSSVEEIDNFIESFSDLSGYSSNDEDAIDHDETNKENNADSLTSVKEETKFEIKNDIGGDMSDEDENHSVYNDFGDDDNP
jgi:hypothetical protein